MKNYRRPIIMPEDKSLPRSQFDALKLCQEWNIATLDVINALPDNDLKRLLCSAPPMYQLPSFYRAAKRIYKVVATWHARESPDMGPPTRPLA
jgi:hypothetical protein